MKHLSSASAEKMGWSSLDYAKLGMGVVGLLFVARIIWDVFAGQFSGWDVVDLVLIVVMGFV